jgi:hypothetical protein
LKAFTRCERVAKRASVGGKCEPETYFPPDFSQSARLSPIRERAEEVKVRHPVEISPDPKDDPLCVCFEQGKDVLIVTLNPRDFPEDRLKSKVILPGVRTMSEISR